MLKSKRFLAALLAVVLLFTSAPFVGVAAASDDAEYSESTNLNDFLVNWKLTVGDAVYSDDTVGADTVIEYKEGMQYSLELNFAESQTLGFETPATEPPVMLFQLPDCFQLPADLQMPLNVNLGRKGVLPDNIISVITDQLGTDGNTHDFLQLTWNWEDTLHWGFFRDSAQAKLKIVVKGTFRDNDPNVLSINGKDVAVRREDLHNAIVSKEGDYDHETGVIDYTVTVSSQGTTSDITLTDTLGSALVYLTDAQHNNGVVYDAADSVNSANTAPVITQKTGNTFNVVIPEMKDGDRLVFRYSAKVDYSRIAVSGAPTFEETGNTAQLFGDSYTVDNTAMYHETDIEFSDLEKNVINKRKQTINGIFSYVLTWEIDTNKRAQYPLAGTDIIDTIGETVQSFSKYTGDGVSIRCYSEDGVLRDTRSISWAELGVDLQNDVTWTYHIPDTDPQYHYVLTYDTIVYMDGQTDTVVADNIAEGKGGIDSDRAVLAIPGSSGFGVTKRVIDQDSSHVTWEITMTVSGTALDYQRLVLTEHYGTKNNGTTWSGDSLPVKWIQLPGESNRMFKEVLKKVEVVGLQENETFKVTYGRANTPAEQTDYFPAAGSSVLETDFEGYRWGGDACAIEFYKDGARTEGGLIKPEGESPSRTLVVRLTTEFPEEWATYARDYLLANSSLDSTVFSHINWISVDTPDNNGKLVTRAFDTDKINPLPLHIYKTTRNGNDSTVATDSQRAFYILNYPNCIVLPWSTTETGRLYPDEPVFPCFRYQVMVSGVKYDEPIVIEENFDTSLLTVMSADDFQGGSYVMTCGDRKWTHEYFPKVFGMKKFDWPPSTGSANYNGTEPEFSFYGFGYDNRDYYRKAEDYGCTFEKTETGFRITIEHPFKDTNGDLYPYYGLYYFLIPKDLEALKTIEEMAKANALAGGEPKVTFGNTASTRGLTANANVKIGVTNDFLPIDKTSETYLDLLNPYQDQTRVQLEDATVGGQTVKDTPEGIHADDIQRYLMKYRVVLNKGKERLNDGNDITVEDEYSSNLSVDFGSIQITADPASAADRISYDYSGNIGYFVIPDETKVIIEYEATVLQTDAGMTDVSNEVRMLQYKKTLDDTIEHGGAGGSSATNPAILLKKYGSGHMEKGLNGAQFQLYEYNYPTYTRGDPNTAEDWTPVILTKPDIHPAVFTTQDLTIGDIRYGDGYAEIGLSQVQDGTTLQQGKVYGLREITTPVETTANGDTIHYKDPHNENFYCYIFSICENGETADYSNYVFLADDTMTVRNTPESTSLHLEKQLLGNCTLSSEETAALTYQVFRKQQLDPDQPAVYMPIMTETTDPLTGQDITVIDDRFVGITYQMITQNNGLEISGLTVENGAAASEYLLVEYGNETILAAHPDWAWRGTYLWNDDTEGTFSSRLQTVYDAEGVTPSQVYGIPFTVTTQEIRDGESKAVTIRNSYSQEVVNLTANKRWTGPTGTTTAWPSGKTVTFALGTLNDSNDFTAIDGKTVQLDNVKDANGEETAGSAVFRNLPKYEVVTEGGQLVTREIRYAVRESVGAAGYDVVYPESGVEYAAFAASAAVTIKNRVQSTSVSVFKAWDRSVPADASATLRLFSYTEGSAPSTAVWVSNVNDIVLDGTVDAGESTFGEKAAWRADFTGLPEYDGNGNRLLYIVKEIGCTPAGYETADAYAANGGTITNAPGSTDVTFRKLWSGTLNDAWPANEQITLRLGRKTRAGTVDSSFSADYVLAANAIVSQESTLDPYGDAQQTGTWENGVLTVSDLPKYDANGDEWLYFFTETAVRNAVTNQDVSANYNTQYRDKNNYLLAESYTYSGGSLTNVVSVRQLTVSKTLAGSDADYTDSFRFTVTLLQTDGTAYSENVTYTGTDASGSTSSGVLTLSGGSATFTLSHGEQVTLQDLPCTLLYTVTENAEDAADYQTAYSVNGASPVDGRSASGTLANSPEVAFINTRSAAIDDRNVSIVGSVTWDDDNNSDGIRPSSITIDLYAGDEKVQSKTITAEDDWSWSFTAPKYDENETEIVYTVKQEAVEGYTATVVGYDVTNKHEPGTGTNDPGTDPNDPGTDPNEPGTDPNEPGTNTPGGDGTLTGTRKITFFAPDRVSYQIKDGPFIIDNETFEFDANETVYFIPLTSYGDFNTLVYINEKLVEPGSDGWYAVEPGRLPVLVSVTPGYIDEDTRKPRSLWELLYSVVQRLFNFITRLFKKG